MKQLIKNTIIIFLLITSFSCSKMIEDYYQDPDRITTAEIDKLFTKMFINDYIKPTYWDYATYPHSPWKTPGGDYAPATASIGFEIPFQWNEWVVTEDVKKWHNSEVDNFGWLLKDANEGSSEGLKVEYMNWFYSFGVEDAPKLIIEMGNRQVNLMFSPYMLITLYGLIISILFISRTIVAKK